jgi:hypothetical protein
MTNPIPPDDLIKIPTPPDDLIKIPIPPSELKYNNFDGLTKIPIPLNELEFITFDGTLETIPYTDDFILCMEQGNYFISRFRYILFSKLGLIPIFKARIKEEDCLLPISKGSQWARLYKE